MRYASMARRIGSLIIAVAGLALCAWPVIAQQSTPPAEPPKQEEVPFWAIGRPQAGAGAQMAPVPAFPIPTPADKLPIAKMKVPPGFKVELYAANVFDARGLRQGDKGTVFVSSLFGAGKIYALVDKGGTREVKTIAEKLMLPNGIEFHKGSLYVATPKDITRYDDIEAKLDSPPDAGDGLRQAPGRRAARLEVHQDRARRQALRAGGRALQHLRARPGEVRPDPPHEPRRQRHGDRGPRGAQHGGLRLPPEDRRAVLHRQPARLALGGPAERRAEPGHQAGPALRLSLLPPGRLRGPAVRLGQGLRRLREAGPAAGPALGPARHALLHRQDVPARSTRTRSSSPATGRGTAPRSTPPTWWRCS